MSFFKVITDIREYSTRDGDADDSWDRGDTAADIYIEGVEFAERYFDVALPQEYCPSKPLYLVWANYNTGDSFGRDDNKFEAVDIFQDRDRAYAAQKALSTEESSSISYVRDDGTTIKYSCSWNGYFESLNYIEVEEVSILGHDNSVNMQHQHLRYTSHIEKGVIEEELNDVVNIDELNSAAKRKM